MKYEKLENSGETESSVKIKLESEKLEIIKSLNKELTREIGRQGSSLED